MKHIPFFGMVLIFFGMSLLWLALMSKAHAECNTQETTSTALARVETPKGLEGATIVLIKADGSAHKFSADEYMVAKRIKTTKVVNRTVACSTDAAKPLVAPNEILFGVRQDYVGTQKAVGASAADIKVLKGPVVDAQYIRKNVLGTRLNGGLGIDSNLTPKALVGIDF